ncbi:DUF2752 domain-containing protein [Granulicoccus sp. GXG6511]|uniref:DUF2752 domain-containing protein n=1 Tax=Granulicoccus sp. GXG6511 TaxID=3381351 RepID=UPI003D7E3958
MKSVTPGGPLSAGVDGVRRLGWLSLFGGACAVAGGVYVVTGEGAPCPFLAVTGWLCPLCGGSRMGGALLRGDVAAAWGWNPYVLVLATVLAGVWVWTALRIALERPAGLPGLLGRLDTWRPAWIVLLLAAPGLVFMLLRNVL